MEAGGVICSFVWVLNIVCEPFERLIQIDKVEESGQELGAQVSHWFEVDFDSIALRKVVILVEEELDDASSQYKQDLLVMQTLVILKGACHSLPPLVVLTYSSFWTLVDRTIDV